jgi:hypothetical protein
MLADPYLFRSFQYELDHQFSADKAAPQLGDAVIG